MLGLFRGKNEVALLKNQMNQLLISSFNKVRQDTSNLYRWVDYLYKHNLHLENQVEELKIQLKNMPVSKQEIKQILEEYYDHESFLHRIKYLEKKIDNLVHKSHLNEDDIDAKISAKLSNELSNLNARQLNPQINQEVRSESKVEEAMQPVVEKLTQISNALQWSKHPKSQVSFTNLKEKIVKTITRNSKDYVKNIILNLVQKYDKISGLQLREIVVEEQALTSKSTFYRLLTELENDKKVDVAYVGKEKVYYSIGLEKHNSNIPKNL